MSEEKEDRIGKLRTMYANNSLQDLVSVMHALRADKDRVEEELKQINEEFDLIRFEMVPDAMEEEGIERVRYEGIGTVYLRSGLRASINPQRRDEAFVWLDDNGHGDLVKPTVNAQSLAAAVGKIVADGTVIPTGLINIYPYTQAVITK